MRDKFVKNIRSAFLAYLVGQKEQGTYKILRGEHFVRKNNNEFICNIISKAKTDLPVVCCEFDLAASACCEPLMPLVSANGGRDPGAVSQSERGLDGPDQ